MFPNKEIFTLLLIETYVLPIATVAIEEHTETMTTKLLGLNSGDGVLNENKKKHTD